MKCLFILLSMISLPCYADQSVPALIRLTPTNGNEVFYSRETISSYCAKFKTQSYVKCIDEKEIQWSLTVFESASLSSKKIGKIIVSIFRPGGPTAKYYSVESKAQDYVPNILSRDYGNHFDFPILKQVGDWIQLPQNPFPNPVWINIPSEWQGTDLKEMLRPIDINTIYEHPAFKHNMVIVKVLGDTVTYRDQYPADMACGEKVDPKLKKPKEKEILIKDLLDKDGHLPLKDAYPAGC